LSLTNKNLENGQYHISQPRGLRVNRNYSQMQRATEIIWKLKTFQNNHANNNTTVTKIRYKLSLFSQLYAYI